MNSFLLLGHNGVTDSPFEAKILPHWEECKSEAFFPSVNNVH